MTNLLIAYNNDTSDDMADVFDACAVKAKEICIKHSCSYEQVTPPNLSSNNVCGNIAKYQMLFIAAHGDNDGVYNEKAEENGVVTIKTTNYDFNGKAFYSVSCNAANHLQPELMKIGLLFFVGYDDGFLVQGDIDPFCECALTGLDCFLSGRTIAESKKEMYAAFDKKIKELELTNKTAARWLTHDKLHLCFEGEDSLTINDLK